MDDLSCYDYYLPQELIAAEPLARRDEARLLVVERQRGTVRHRTVRDLPELLNPGDCLVLNDTQVIPARLFGRRAATGGKWEGLYLETAPSGNWRLIGQSRGRLHPGEQVMIVPAHSRSHAERGNEKKEGSEKRREAETQNDELPLTLLEQNAEGVWTARPEAEGDTLDLLRRFGTVPLPPYIHRKLATEADRDRYQTTYSRRPGAVAAPTAGLHFTPELLGACRNRGVRIAYVTLHVGIGTFRPIAVERLSEHRMHAEWCELPAESAELLTRTKAGGGRIVAVGTTTVRTLESAARTGELRPWQGETDLFIRPPYEFRAVDCLLTNFHLPRSTLLVLVSTFAGIDLVKTAYAAAIREKYRFYSYGDAMLIL